MRPVYLQFPIVASLSMVLRNALKLVKAFVSSPKICGCQASKSRMHLDTRTKLLHDRSLRRNDWDKGSRYIAAYKISGDFNVASWLARKARYRLASGCWSK